MGTFRKFKEFFGETATVAFCTTYAKWAANTVMLVQGVSLSQSDRPAHFLQLFNIVVMLAVFSEITRQKLKIWLAALVMKTPNNKLWF